MRKKLKAILALTVITVLLMSTGVFAARTVNSFNNFNVTLYGNEVDTSWIGKGTTQRPAVLSLINDSGFDWVYARMKATNNLTVGSCTAQQGTSVSFANIGIAGQYYSLGLKSAYNSYVHITKGSWSPDIY